MKLSARYQLLFPSEGSKTMSFRNDFGWLNYTWIDIGTPNLLFLVALCANLIIELSLCNFLRHSFIVFSSVYLCSRLLVHVDDIL
ncbi:hypothetical protein SLA2020_446600 [Shorea laevis]